jgi:hypothetical protein
VMSRMSSRAHNQQSGGRGAGERMNSQCMR